MVPKVWARQMDLPQQGSISAERFRSIVRRGNRRTIEVWEVLGVPRTGTVACAADQALAQATMEPFQEAHWVVRHRIPFEPPEVFWSITRDGLAALGQG